MTDISLFALTILLGVFACLLVITACEEMTQESGKVALGENFTVRHGSARYKFQDLRVQVWTMVLCLVISYFITADTALGIFLLSGYVVAAVLIGLLALGSYTWRREELEWLCHRSSNHYINRE
jgi:hypothetical protein